jgi:Fur family ferric uptake transcriptional regulator
MTSATKTGSKSSTWAGYALDQLSEAGYRSGSSRRKVVELLGGQSCAITALELDHRLDGVGRATVYRSLEQMEELGLVQRIDVGGDSAGYEKVDPEGRHHHHIVCTDCGKVVPFEDKKLEKAIHEVSKRDGFEIQSHDITLKGTCEDC